MSLLYVFRSAEHRQPHTISNQPVLPLTSKLQTTWIKTSSVYDCTVEDVEYIYNKLSIHCLVFVWSDLCVKYIHVVIALTGAHMQPACVTELTSSEY